MTPRALLLQAAKEFREAGIPDPESDASLLLSHLCGKPPLSLRLDTDTELPAFLADSFRALAARRLRREPLQYIIREASFCGRTFHVDPRVLIPRPETELLCRWAFELPLSPGMKVLDLCCGSGCIGLTLAAGRPDLRVTLSDISRDALDVAALNASRLGLHPEMLLSDLTSSVPGGSFDLIVSNPPYIPSAECRILQPEVLCEPVLALDGGTDGLGVYRKIAADAARVLRENGMLLMELGYGEAVPVRNLLESHGYTSVETRKDLNGIDRMILAHNVPRRPHD